MSKTYRADFFYMDGGFYLPSSPNKTCYYKEKSPKEVKDKIISNEEDRYGHKFEPLKTKNYDLASKYGAVKITEVNIGG